MDALFLQKSCGPFLVVAPIFGIFEAHRTLLVETTVLPYWIQQALHPDKASFSVKKTHSVDDWGMAPLPPGYALR